MVCHARPQTRWFVEQARRRNDGAICRERAYLVTPEKQRWWENIDTLQRGTYDCRAITTHHFGVYGAVADWCQDLAQRIKAHSPPGTGTPVTNVDNDPAPQVPAEDASNLTKSRIWTSGARGNLVRQHEEKIENLPEDRQLTKACNDAGFMRNVSRKQFFITIPEVHLPRNGSTSSCR